MSVPAPIIPTSGEGLNIPLAGKIQDTTAYRDVRELSTYDFMEHTYCGSHGYRDNSYLIPNDRETFYDTRRKASYYVNVFKPIINAMVDPVYNGDISRETDNDMLRDFLGNVDNCGTDINTFMRQAIRNARIYSVNFIIMDNFPPERMEEVDTIQSAVDERAYPYIYEKRPQDIKEYCVSPFGRLERVTFFDREEYHRDADSREVCRKYYREWDAQTWREYYEEQGAYINGTKHLPQITTAEGTHGLGFLPVIPIIDFARSANLTQLPVPEFYDLAMLTFALYNKESHVVQMELYQTFSILCTSGLNKQAIALGVATLIDSGTDSKYPPQYVSPSQEGIKVLIDNCQRLKDEIKAQAQQRGVVGVQNTTSGISKEWDFRAEEAVLRQTSMAGQRVEKLIADMFGAYINQSIEYEVKYPLRFSPMADRDELTEIMAMLDKVPPPEVAAALWRRAVEIKFKQSPEVIEEIKESVQMSSEERASIEAMRAAESTDGATE